MKVIGYLRVSTAGQATDGFGLVVQRAEIEAWARKNRHQVVEWFTDEGVSGTMPAMEREGLSGALEAISDGRASGLVVARMDRLARLLVESEAALALVWNFGGSMFSVDSGEVQRDESDEPLVRALRLIVATIGELERNTLIVRMRRGREAKAAAGGYAYGSPPLGSTSRGGVLVPELREAAAVARIVELRAEGRSLRDIGRVLQDEGVPTKRGGRWHPETISKVLARCA